MQKSMYITIQLPFSVCGLTSTHLTLTFAFDLNIFSTVLLLPLGRVQIKCILFLKCLVWNNHPLDPENFLSNPFLSKKVISVSKLFICFKNHHWTITTKNVTSKSVVTNILRSNFCFPWYSILSNMKICQCKMSETKY